VLSYRVILDVPLPLAVFVSGLLADHRREIGTRTGTRALTCWKQAVFTLAWFRDRPDIRRLGRGFGISQATAYRYKDEAVEVLAAKAPTLREALDKAVEQGLPYLILDGTLISSDRCADKKTSRKGKEIDKWYSGKAHEPAGNVQALAAPGGVPLWVSDVLPGSTHDLTAARELVLPEARPYLKDLPILADSGYEGAGAGVHVPVKKPAGGKELDPDTKTRNALLRSLRYQGERGFALMSQRWRALQRVMVSPTTIGDIAKSVLVLVQFEHKMIS
jgi:DDE superfamily endonuclease